jgi:hypothetical protein
MASPAAVAQINKVLLKGIAWCGCCVPSENQHYVILPGSACVVRTSMHPRNMESSPTPETFVTVSMMGSNLHNRFQIDEAAWLLQACTSIDFAANSSPYLLFLCSAIWWTVRPRIFSLPVLM